MTNFSCLCFVVAVSMSELSYADANKSTVLRRQRNNPQTSRDCTSVSFHCQLNNPCRPTLCVAGRSIKIMSL